MYDWVVYFLIKYIGFICFIICELPKDDFMSLNFDNLPAKNNMYKATFGVEKENLRVTENGCLSHTKHPFHGNSNIDRDFCENQVEIITDVWDSTDAAFRQLSHLHNTVVTELSKLASGRDLLWPFSNPPYVKGESDIPIASYKESLKGKEIYRKYLAEKYGKKKMLFSGIHFNFSFGDELIESNRKNAYTDSFCEHKNRLYLELSFGREQNLFVIQNRFAEYYEFLQNQFKPCNYTLTGMGVNPYHQINRNVPVPNGRYRMLFHHLNSYKKYSDTPMYFHNHPEYGTFSSASQVQLDVSFDRLPLTLNIFSNLEPIKALLFSNSVLLDEDEENLCCRDMFRENSTHGINPHNIGMYDCEFENTDDILSYIESTSIYCVERGEKYINFAPIRLDDYFSSDKITGEYFENGEYRRIEFKPQLSDLEYLRTFKFEDLTFRGTIEFRSVCCQPIKDSFCVAAFHIGLMDKVEELAEILENDRILYHHGYKAGELRKMLVRSELPKFIDEDRLYDLARQIVNLAYKGLSERGNGEEKLLNPLYERIESRTNPAKRMISLKHSKTDLKDIIKEYSFLILHHNF